MDFGLRGKVALVCGAGGGLGSAIALALAREGAAVAACDINLGALEAVGNQLRAIGATMKLVHMDLSRHETLGTCVEEITDSLGPISILLNNTGGPPPSMASGISAEVWRKHFDQMVLSVVTLTDHVLPAMRQARWGRIITSTSSGVISPIPNLGLSNALRLSLVGWSKTMSREVAASGITANVILPGRIATSRIDQLDRARAEREKRPIEEVIQDSTASIPTGRYGRPEEYGAVVAFLASEPASYINGSVVRVDGGMISSI